MYYNNHMSDRSQPSSPLPERSAPDDVLIRFLLASARYFSMPAESSTELPQGNID